MVGCELIIDFRWFLRVVVVSVVEFFGFYLCIVKWEKRKKIKLLLLLFGREAYFFVLGL